MARAKIRFASMLPVLDGSGTGMSVGKATGRSPAISRAAIFEHVYESYPEQNAGVYT
jgi:hypothetical protein